MSVASGARKWFRDLSCPNSQWRHRSSWVCSRTCSYIARSVVCKGAPGRKIFEFNKSTTATGEISLPTSPSACTAGSSWQRHPPFGSCCLSKSCDRPLYCRANYPLKRMFVRLKSRSIYLRPRVLFLSRQPSSPNSCRETRRRNTLTKQLDNSANIFRGESNFISAAAVHLSGVAQFILKRLTHFNRTPAVNWISVCMIGRRRRRSKSERRAKRSKLERLYVIGDIQFSSRESTFVKFQLLGCHYSKSKFTLESALITLHNRKFDIAEGEIVKLQWPTLQAVR